MAQKHFHTSSVLPYKVVLIYGNKTQVNYNSASLNLCMLSVYRIIRIYSEFFVNVIALGKMFEWV